MTDIGKAAYDLALNNASKLLDYAWNLDKGLRNWNIAKAKSVALNTQPNIVFLGDSITAATGATTSDSGFVGLIRNAMQMSTGLAGHGFVCENVFIPDGTWTTFNSGTNLKTYKATPASNSVSFKDFIKSVDVIYSTYPDGGTATIKIDGSTVGTINCNGAQSYHNVATFTVSNASPHTLQVVPATSGNTYIEGFNCYSGTSGLLVHRVGHAGIKCADYINSADIIASTSAFNPMLTAIMLGTNDSGVIDIPTYTARLDAIVKQALTTGDVLIMSMGDRSDGKTSNPPYSAYVDAQKQVAITNNTAYLSIYDRWNRDYTWANNKGLMFDTVHPNQAGHADIAEALRTVLSIAFPVSGVWRIHYDVQYPYGDVEMVNAPANLRTSDVVLTGLHAKRIDVAVSLNATSLVVNNSTSDGSYAVTVAPNWNTTYWITGKGYAGFTINFGTAAPSGATLDWTITR